MAPSVEKKLVIYAGRYRAFSQTRPPQKRTSRTFWFSKLHVNISIRTIQTEAPPVECKIKSYAGEGALPPDPTLTNLDIHQNM